MRCSTLVVLVVAFAAAVATAQCCNYPTLWSVENKTNYTLTFVSKDRVDVVAGPRNKLVKPISAVVAPGTTYVHEFWGYNDGLGESPMSVSCATGTEPDPMNAPLNPSRPLTDINTSWGENCNVVLTEDVVRGFFVVTRVSR